MPRAGTVELGIARAYLQQADEATDREWERMWLDMAMTRLLCAEGDDAFNARVMALYRAAKERHERLSIELGYRDNPYSAELSAKTTPSLQDILASRLAYLIAGRIAGGEEEADIIKEMDPRGTSRLIPRAIELSRRVTLATN